ncbi:unnamed protein product [Notodromas monacha]|uniref:Uncharacterized protein n=1 Tax=Notodromas monacha TaxID=399045 RepID=A0A7R9BVL3_9CRUS|nr:unnamed protein product [Notodromas monacha]CAG0921042.1 unnamed protein product [Notodromas monacha]
MRLAAIWGVFTLLAVLVAADTSFYADGSIDYENSDFDDLASPVASQTQTQPVSDDRKDVVLESRKPVTQDADDITNPEYFKEARANAEHIRNLASNSRIRSNDKVSDSESGLAQFLAAHAVKDDVKMDQDWYAPSPRSVPQIAAGIGEYEIRNPIIPIQTPYVPSSPPNLPMTYIPQTQPQSYYPPLDYRRPMRPPNSNAVYARAMMVGMKPIGPPLEVNPALPSMQSNFNPYGPYEPVSGSQVEYLGAYDPYSDRYPMVRPTYEVQDGEEEDEDEGPLDDSKLDDLPVPEEDKQIKKTVKTLGGNPGTSDIKMMLYKPPRRLYLPLLRTGGPVLTRPFPPLFFHQVEGRPFCVKIKTNSQGKINVMIEGGDGKGKSSGPDPKKLEEHMTSAIANAASVKERIAAQEASETWNLTTTVTVSLGFLLAGIVGIMGFTLMQQRARQAEREDSTTIHSRSASKVELGQDLSDYCYREDVRRLAHILEDD